jgi:TonB family protein
VIDAAALRQRVLYGVDAATRERLFDRLGRPAFGAGSGSGSGSAGARSRWTGVGSGVGIGPPSARLQGTVVVKLTIAPSGQVTDAEVVSSELNDASLERRIELRVMQLDFGARQVKSTTVEYPIDFFPS